MITSILATFWQKFIKCIQYKLECISFLIQGSFNDCGYLHTDSFISLYCVPVPKANKQIWRNKVSLYFLKRGINSKRFWFSLALMFGYNTYWYNKISKTISPFIYPWRAIRVHHWWGFCCIVYPISLILKITHYVNDRGHCDLI